MPFPRNELLGGQQGRKATGQKNSFLIALAIMPGINLLLGMIVLASGADILDGLAASTPTNSDLQNSIAMLFLLSFLVTPVVALVYSIGHAVRGRETGDRKRFIAPATILAIVVLLAAWLLLPRCAVVLLL